MEAPSTDTIVAISSPAGRGGIGVLRLSGPRSASIASALFSPATGSAAAPPGTSPGPRRLRFGRFLDAGGATLDHGYLVVFDPPRTFTGEESAELWAHGSPVVLRLLLERAVTLGARPATPGEFSLRAFLNGRIDVTQAEAIRDLIEARTAFQARVAIDQVRGRISAEVDRLKDRLAETVARLEASIEFSEEEDARLFLPRDGVHTDLAGARRAIEALAATWDRGRLVRDGAAVVIIGAPNVGKSSIFNKLLYEDRAIVTAVPGTTRDLLEETIDLAGVPVRLIDTAGLHDPRDAADTEAVRRAREASEGVDLLLVVLDRSRPLLRDERDLLRGLGTRRALSVLNKSDLPPGLGAGDMAALAGGTPPIEVSARTGDGLEALRECLAQSVAREGIERECVFVTNLRHRDLLVKSAAAVRRAEGAARDGLQPECLLIDLKEALDRLGEITGEVGIEGIYERIFRNFCIGK